MKTFWEKEKLLVKSNFSFSLNVFFFSRIDKLSSIFITFKIVVRELVEFKTDQSVSPDNGKMSGALGTGQCQRTIAYLRLIDVRSNKIPQ